MYEFLTKKGEMIAFGLGVLLVLIFLGTVLPNLDQFNALPEDQQTSSGVFDIGLWLAIILLIVTAVVAVVAGLWQLIMNPKGSVKVLAGIGLLALILIIFYATSEAETTGRIAEVSQEFEVGEKASRFISGAIKTSLALCGLSALAFVVGELLNTFK
ncbi:MAG: hypothetical protein KJP00_14995 [Bacteroidia bacterium]|nr:hypothetical protein [Bacteroidia bacterium]